MSCKTGSDKLTTALAQLIKARRFRKLDPCEQLGYIVMASYMRSPQLAEFMLKSTGNNMSLVQCLVDFFRETGGVAARKAFLPSRRVAAPAAPAAKRKAESVADVCQGGLRVIYQLIITKLTACLKWQALIKPNRDIAKMGLKDVLSMASQFLDGSLSELMLTQPRGQWQVDVDQRLDSRQPCRELRLGSIDIPARQLMPVHIAETLRELGLLGGGLEVNGRAAQSPSIDWWLGSIWLGPIKLHP